MSFLDEFADWMQETVTWEPATGLNGYGQPTYGAAQPVACYLAGQLRTIQAFDGTERTSRVQVYLATPVGAGPDDRITLPSGWTPASPPLLQVQRLRDDVGDLVEVLYA